jgi:hypothetical protein
VPAGDSGHAPFVSIQFIPYLKPRDLRFVIASRKLTLLKNRRASVHRRPFQGAIIAYTTSKSDGNERFVEEVEAFKILRNRLTVALVF